MNYLYKQVWLRPSNTSQDMGEIPAGTRTFLPFCVTETAWDSDGSDLIRIGHEDDDDAYGQDLNVAVTSKSTDFTAGVDIGYTSKARRVSATYTAGGSTPTVGFSLVVLPYILVRTN